VDSPVADPTQPDDHEWLIVILVVTLDCASPPAALRAALRTDEYTGFERATIRAVAVDLRPRHETSAVPTSTGHRAVPCAAGGPDRPAGREIGSTVDTDGTIHLDLSALSDSSAHLHDLCRHRHT